MSFTNPDLRPEDSTCVKLKMFDEGQPRYMHNNVIGVTRHCSHDHLSKQCLVL